MATAPRYERLADLLKLAVALSNSRQGLSVEEMRDLPEGRVSRRTAERMRAAVQVAFPRLEEWWGDDGLKRWRLPDALMPRLLGFTAPEMAELKDAVRRLRAGGESARADVLQGALDKILALLPASRLLALEIDTDALLEAEGLAHRPGPRERVPAERLDALRDAILKCQRVRIHYRARGTGKHSRQVIEPHGFLHGHRHYLVAWNPFEDKYMPEGFRLFDIAGIGTVELLDRSFTRQDGFRIDRYARGAFGVYFGGKAHKVVLRVRPDMVEEAKNTLFHPTQVMRDMKDGRLEIRFTCHADKDLCWYLFTWGDAIELVSPKALRDRYLDLLGQARRTYRKRK